MTQNPENVGFAIPRRFRCHCGDCPFPMVSKRTKKCFWHSHMKVSERQRWEDFKSWIQAKYGIEISLPSTLPQIAAQLADQEDTRNKIRGIRKGDSASGRILGEKSLKSRAESLKSFFLKKVGEETEWED